MSIIDPVSKALATESMLAVTHHRVGEDVVADGAVQLFMDIGSLDKHSLDLWRLISLLFATAFLLFCLFCFLLCSNSSHVLLCRDIGPPLAPIRLLLLFLGLLFLPWLPAVECLRCIDLVD